MRQVHDRVHGVEGACVSPERMQQAAKAAADVARLKRGFETLEALQVHLHSGGRTGEFPIHETVWADAELQGPWSADGAAAPAAPLCLQRINRITGGGVEHATRCVRRPHRHQRIDPDVRPRRGPRRLRHSRSPCAAGHRAHVPAGSADHRRSVAATTPFSSSLSIAVMRGDVLSDVL